MGLDEAWENVWRATTPKELFEARNVLNRELVHIHEGAKKRLAITTFLRIERQILSNAYHLANLHEAIEKGEGLDWDWPGKGR